MNEMLEFYQQQAKAHLSTLPWLADLQSQAAVDLNRTGFPTRAHEEWKYTRVETLLQQSFVEADQSARLKYINNLISVTKERIKTLPKGVLILPLATALTEHSELIKPYLGRIIQQEHAFHFLNTSMMDCGVFIFIPKGVSVVEPLILTHNQDKELQALYLRHLIIAQDNSEATIVEEYTGTENSCYMTNTVTELALGIDAKIAHYKIQCDSKSAYHLGHLAVSQLENSQFSSYSLSLGGKLVRSDLSIYLQEEYAQCFMNGIYAPTEGQHIDHHTTVHHLVPNCQSNQDYKGILNGHSHAVFNGKVIVAKDAQHTNANQQNKNLLLSQGAEVNTKPQLEIFADDVLCSHGATVGQLDEEALFYLATRGIDRKEASHYLIHAFTENNLKQIPNTDLAQWWSRLLTQQVE